MRPREHGFSLVELMVSVTLGLIVLAILATVFAHASTARTELQRSSQQMDNGRYAVDVLSQDLQLAGYFGELNVAGLAVPGALPDLCSTAPADWVAAIPFHLQGYDEANGAPSCMPTSVKAGSDVVAVRRVRTCIAGAAGCEPVVATQPYLQVGLCGSAGSAYALGVAQDTAFPHKLKDCTTDAGRRRYTVNVYFVSADNGSGAAIPTLKRLEFNGAGYTEVALVEGIERLQIEYGIDTDGNGAPDAYAADPGTYTYPGCVTCSAVSNWANVVTAKLHVLSRSLEPASRGYVDNKVYDLGKNAAGARVTAGPFGDAYRRQVYTAAVRIMNLSGRREIP